MNVPLYVVVNYSNFSVDFASFNKNQASDYVKTAQGTNAYCYIAVSEFVVEAPVIDKVHIVLDKCAAGCMHPVLGVFRNIEDAKLNLFDKAGEVRSYSIYTPEDAENLKAIRVRELKKEINQLDMELLKSAFQKGEL